MGNGIEKYRSGDNGRLYRTPEYSTCLNDAKVQRRDEGRTYLNNRDAEEWERDRADKLFNQRYNTQPSNLKDAINLNDVFNNVVSSTHNIDDINSIAETLASQLRKRGVNKERSVEIVQGGIRQALSNFFGNLFGVVQSQSDVDAINGAINRGIRSGESLADIRSGIGREVLDQYYKEISRQGGGENWNSFASRYDPEAPFLRGGNGSQNHEAFLDVSSAVSKMKNSKEKDLLQTILRASSSNHSQLDGFSFQGTDSETGMSFCRATIGHGGVGTEDNQIDHIIILSKDKNDRVGIASGLGIQGSYGLKQSRNRASNSHLGGDVTDVNYHDPNLYNDPTYVGAINSSRDPRATKLPQAGSMEANELVKRAQEIEDARRLDQQDYDSGMYSF